jgi:hypothetical protein
MFVILEKSLLRKLEINEGVACGRIAARDVALAFAAAHCKTFFTVLADPPTPDIPGGKKDCPHHGGAVPNIHIGGALPPASYHWPDSRSGSHPKLFQPNTSAGPPPGPSGGAPISRPEGSMLASGLFRVYAYRFQLCGFVGSTALMPAGSGVIQRAWTQLYSRAGKSQRYAFFSKKADPVKIFKAVPVAHSYDR